MSIDTVINLYQGMHFEGELRMLNRIAAGVDEGVIVAIGSYRGQTDCALALHARVPVYAIDDRSGSVDEDFPFGDIDRPIWMNNVLALGLGEKIRPINLQSAQVAEVWDKPVGMLFIDGSHDYVSVKTDLACWLPHVVENGLVALHDNNKPGVMQAIEDVKDRLELIEAADLTNVYRLKRTGVQFPASDGSFSFKAEDAGSEDADLIGTPIATFSGENDYAIGKSEPDHPSQRPKTPAKKKTTVKRK